MTLATINIEEQNPIHIILNAIIGLGIVPDHQLKMLQRQTILWQVRHEKYEAREAEKARLKAEKKKLKEEKARLKAEKLKTKPMGFQETMICLATKFGWEIPRFDYSIRKKEPVLPLQNESIVADTTIPTTAKATAIEDDSDTKVYIAEILDDEDIPKNVIFHADRGEWEEVVATDNAITEIILRNQRNEYANEEDLRAAIYDIINLHDTKLTRMAAYSLLDDICNGRMNDSPRALQYFGENVDLDKCIFKTLAQSKQSIDNILQMIDQGMWRELNEVFGDGGSYTAYPNLTYCLASSWLSCNSFYTKIEESYEKKMQERDILFNKIQLKDPRSYVPHVDNFE